MEKSVPLLYKSQNRLSHHSGTGTFIRKGKGGERKRRGREGGRETREGEGKKRQEKEYKQDNLLQPYMIGCR